MPRVVEYHCENARHDAKGAILSQETPPACDYVTEELFNDTEERPTTLPGVVCPKCGGRIVRSLNLKNNCQVWGVHKL